MEVPNSLLETLTLQNIQENLQPFLQLYTPVTETGVEDTKEKGDHSKS